MFFDRFDICEAWYLALTHCHGGQWSKEYLRLCKMQKYFRPSPLMSVDSLSENAKVIYYEACKKMIGG